ncbi:MAG: hypothetical protein AAF490_31945 [Chloroflexota bacterium]
MKSKIKIKMGDIEIEYEGSEEFLQKDFPEMLATIVELKQLNIEDDLEGIEEDDLSEENSVGGFKGTTSTVAARLKVSSGSDLVIAAASRLTLVLNQESFSRSELLKEMQAAKAYYKTSYRKNLSNYLKTLVGADRIREVAKDTYAMSASERNKVETKLAG